MTLQAQYWNHEPGQAPTEEVATLTTIADVQQFVATLSGQAISDAIVTHLRRPRVNTAIPDDDDPGSFMTVPDHSVIVGVHGERGALCYRGHDGRSVEPVHLYSHGDTPDHSVLYETDEFPPHCEVPVTTLIEALTEFLRTAKRPVSIDWQPAQP